MAERSVNNGETGAGVAIGRAIKIAGETWVAPGSSLILDGQVLQGAAHVVGGLLARWAIGPVGWLLFAADSYSRSVTGVGVTEHFQRQRLAPAAEPAEAAVARVEEKPRSGRRAAAEPA